MLIQRKRQVDPEFAKYKKQIGKIATVVGQMSETVDGLPETEGTTKLVSLCEQQDELGQLAKGVKDIAARLNQGSIVAIDESSASLSARLTLFTENRKNIISPITLEQLKMIIGDALDKWNCKMIDFQGSLEQVQIVFTYPPQVQLSQLVNHLKAISNTYLYEKLQDIIDIDRNNSQSQIWCDYSSYITSCEGLNNS